MFEAAADQPNQAPATRNKCYRAGHAENDTGGGGHRHTTVKGVKKRDTPDKDAWPDWTPDEEAPKGARRCAASPKKAFDWDAKASKRSPAKRRGARDTRKAPTRGDMKGKKKKRKGKRKQTGCRKTETEKERLQRNGLPARISASFYGSVCHSI